MTLIIVALNDHCFRICICTVPTCQHSGSVGTIFYFSNFFIKNHVFFLDFACVNLSTGT